MLGTGIGRILMGDTTSGVPRPELVAHSCGRLTPAFGDWIGRVYDRYRRHQAIGMISLVEYEDRFTDTVEAA
jgi:hypothetical protein